MAKEPIYAAIDIGTSKVMSVVARLGPEGELKPLGMGAAPSLGVQQGIVDDFNEVKEAVLDSLDECLRYMGRNPVDGFYAVVNGDHLSGSTSAEMLGNGEEGLTVTEQHLRSLINRTSGAGQSASDGKNDQILHIIPMRYRMDGVDGIRNPTGLSANELHLDAHVVRGMSVPLANTMRTLESCKVRVQGMVSHPLASGEGVLTADEREMGAAVVDIGAGTIKIAVYRDGTPFYSSVVAMGSNQLTRDLAISQRVPFQMAEELKSEHGHALPDDLDSSEEIILPATQMQPKRIVLRRDLCEPLYLRSLQMLKLVHAELCQAQIETALPGGIVLTGGGARMPGLAEMTERGLRTQVRVGAPLWYAGLPDSLRQPEFAAALGTLRWAVKHRGLSDRTPIRAEGERNRSFAGLLRRPFARSSAPTE